MRRYSTGKRNQEPASLQGRRSRAKPSRGVITCHDQNRVVGPVAGLVDGF
jgi:hypothetical protein